MYLLKTQVGSYYINDLINIITINYKKSFKDFYYTYVYLILSFVIFFLSSFLFYNLYKTSFSLQVSTIIGYFFSFSLFLFGLYFLGVSIETIIKPIKNIFVINKKEKTLKVRKNIFQSHIYHFEEIIGFELRGKKTDIIILNRGIKYKRKLLLFDFFILLKNNSEKKIHSFEKSNFLIPIDKKKSNKSLEENSKKISNLIATYLNKEIIYKGIERIK